MLAIGGLNVGSYLVYYFVKKFMEVLQVRGNQSEPEQEQLQGASSRPKVREKLLKHR
jgi:hypothetical protein